MINLDKWIELLEEPTCQICQHVQYLKEKRELIKNNPESTLKILDDGNIWGGMGSFLDGAMIDIFYYRPNVKDPVERAKQWESAHVICDNWRRRFNNVTIELGTALIKLISMQEGFESNKRKCIETWIEMARNYNQRPYEKLNKTSIETLEWNLKSTLNSRDYT